MPTVPTGSYRFAERIGGWAVYADIAVSVIARNPGHPLVTFAEGISVDELGCEVASIGFGVAYGLAHISDSSKLCVVVHKLHTNPVDTSPAALAFATCQAVLNCFGGSPSNAPYFDRESKSFVLPARG